MAYIEVMKKGNKKYYYLAATVRAGRGFKKVRRYLGYELNEKEMKKLAKINRPLLEREIEKIKTETGRSRVSLTRKQVNELEKIKRKYQKAIKKLNSIEYAVYEKDHLINFTFNTNTIEGSPITLRETRMILEDGTAPKGRDLREIHEVENTKKAYDFLKAYKGDVDIKLIKKIHLILTHNILGEEAGKFRSIQVYMAGSKHIPPPPGEVRKEMNSLVRWYRKYKDRHYPVFISTYIHSAFIAIHPFIDGNGRTGRLLLNFMLMKSGFPPVCIKKEEKEEYIDSLENARDGNIRSFLDFIVKCIRDVEIPEKIVSTKNK